LGAFQLNLSAWWAKKGIQQQQVGGDNVNIALGNFSRVAQGQLSPGIRWGRSRADRVVILYLAMRSYSLGLRVAIPPKRSPASHKFST